jgi:hypothetical protein
LADIGKINAVALANIAKVDAVAAAAIAKINGLVFTAAAPAALLLDTYTGAAFAYSTRLLRTAYTGDIMRVRRASDSVEADVGFDASNELSLTSPISNTSDAQSYTDLADFVDHTGTPTSAFVGKWYDQAGSSDADQSTASSQAKMYDSSTGLIAENGKAAIQTDGTDDTFDVSHSQAATDYSFVYVMKRQNTSSWLLDIQTGRMVIDASNNALYFDGSFRGSANGASADMKLYFLNLKSPSSGAQYINGSADQTGLSYTQKAMGGDIRFFGQYDASGRRVQSITQEFIVWPTDQGTSNRTGIEENINSNYLIYQPTDAPTSGLLADYTGAAAAYSVRQLSDKAVIALRIRRDSDDEETNIGFDSNGDLDTTAISDFCDTANGYVTRWWDQSTNGNHADQATDTSQPQIYNGTAVITENSKPALKGGTLTAPSIAFNGTTSGYFIVNNQPSGQFVWLGNTASNNHNIELERFGDIYWRSAVAVQTIATSAVTMGQQNLIYVMCNASKSDARINASDVTDTSAYPGSSSTIWSLYNGRFGATVGNTVFQEIIYYASDQDSNATGIETDINDYFDIYT